MKPPNERTRLVHLLNFPGWTIRRLAWRFGKVNRYEISGDCIVRHKGLFTTQQIDARQIKHWSVRPEMGFDIVRIELEQGEGVSWIDEHNDLLASLRKLAEPKEIDADETSSSN